MILSTSQVGDKLKVTKSTIRNMVKRGELVDLHAAKNGRHHMAFDSKAIAEYLRTNPAPKKEIPTPEPQGPGFLVRLASIEEKLDRLIQLWS